MGKCREMWGCGETTRVFNDVTPAWAHVGEWHEGVVLWTPEFSDTKVHVRKLVELYHE